ncbi:MAG TPA: M13-type metalloendopeptidase [Steroidobacteraceae bacterium]|nr:M13-type metalloendopeptidase [Steroidobacteraceae bacterium]
MKRLLMTILTASLASCAAAPESPAPGAAPATASATYGSGLDLAGFDRSVRPEDDLFRFVNGEWLKTAVIPADRANYGAFTMLDDQAQADVHELVEKAANASNKAPGSDTQKVGDLYLSFMDTAHIEQLGLKPLKGELARVDTIADTHDLVRYMGYAQSLGIQHPVWYFVAQDEKNATAYISNIYQRGLTLPDRDYYLKTDEKYVAIRAKYVAYVAALLKLAGFEDPQGGAQRIMALETRLATAHWTRVQNRDAEKTYNKYDIAAANALSPGFDWSEFLAGTQANAQELVIAQPSYITALGKAVTELPLDDWKLYMKYKLIDEYAPDLSSAYADLHFDLHLRTLKGVQENQPRWKRAVDTIDTSVGDIAGRLYVGEHFTPQAKRRMDELVANLLKAYKTSIDQLEWMSPATKAAAQAKLAKFTVKIGYPDKWKDYSALTIDKTDLVGNLLRSAAVEHQRGTAKLGKPVDRTEWLMTPQTVNAYYYPPMNDIVFPAAILRPPFFNTAADDATNYGAIGAVIGHEISHGFDDQGRKYDGDGNLRDWWTDEDAKRFKERAEKVVAEYNQFNPIDDMKVNGELTLGENIGDLSGLAIAYKAYKIAEGGKTPPVIDGFTADQRFFLGWSQVWRRKYRDEDLRQRLVTDPHSPSEFRCNGIVTNMPAFYAAFGVKQGDKLYRAPEDRVQIW